MCHDIETRGITWNLKSSLKFNRNSFRSEKCSIIQKEISNKMINESSCFNEHVLLVLFHSNILLLIRFMEYFLFQSQNIQILRIHFILFILRIQNKND